MEGNNYLRKQYLDVDLVAVEMEQHPPMVYIPATAANLLLLEKIRRLERIERAFVYLSEMPVVNTNEMFWQRDKDMPLLEYIDTIFAKNKETLRRMMAKEWK